MAGERSDRDVRTARIAAAVIIAAAIGWLAMQGLGPRLGLAGRYAVLADLIALAAFLWAMIVLVGILRRRSRDGS